MEVCLLQNQNMTKNTSKRAKAEYPVNHLSFIYNFAHYKITSADTETNASLFNATAARV